MQNSTRSLSARLQPTTALRKTHSLSYFLDVRQHLLTGIFSGLLRREEVAQLSRGDTMPWKREDDAMRDAMRREDGRDLMEDCDRHP
ncbi:hypothetical protein GCM10027343_38520 [Noviherbaspirillum agri]